MKRLMLAAGLALAALAGRADEVAPASTVPSGPIPPAPEPAAAAPAAANPVVPAADFQPSRYEVLWKKSPFSVATPEGPTDTSPDYQLYGLANIEGITYASLVDAHTGEHFLISTDKATRGLTLNTVTRSQPGSDTFANVTKDGQMLTLKLATTPPPPPIAGTNAPINAPGGLPQGSPAIVPNITVPGSTPATFNRGSVRPFSRVHRPPITLPTPPPAPPPTPPPAPAP